jgi:hypothetical protein
LLLGDRDVSGLGKTGHQIGKARRETTLRKYHRLVDPLRRHVAAVARKADIDEYDHSTGGTKPLGEEFTPRDEVCGGDRNQRSGENAVLQVDQNKSGGFRIEGDHDRCLLDKRGLAARSFMRKTHKV